MNPGLLFLAGVAASGLLSYCIHRDHRHRYRRILARAARARQSSRDERHRAQLYLCMAADEHEAARRAACEACRALGSVEIRERQVFAASVN